ncbi:TPA: type VI secretion system baseplate subunit TssG [Citrobacter freundii]
MERDRAERTDSVIAQLRREPWRFSLEQCVRLLHLCGEAPQLCGELGLEFTPAETGALRDGSLQVRSLGPGGADGVLPYAWLEALQQARQDKMRAPQDFLNLFQRRLLEHHCRSLDLYRLATPYARRDEAPGFAVMRALCGFASEAQRGAKVHNILAHSGLLANRRRPAAGFVALVAAVLNVTVRTEEFVGRWQALPPAALCRTGCRLGRSSVAGKHAWNQHAALRLHLQIHDAAQWRNFLPGGRGFIQLGWLGQLWFGAGVELLLMMRGTLSLDSRLDRASPPRLGYSAHLAGRHPSSFCCQQYLKESVKWI